MTQPPGAAARPQQPVAHAVFSVDGLPAGERFAAWRESIACIFEVDTEPAIRARGFRALVDSHVLGGMMLVRTTTRKQDWARQSRKLAADGMDHYMIQLFERGTMVAAHRGGTTELPEGGLMVFDLAQPMASRTTDFTNLSLIVPRDQLDAALKSPDDHHMRALSPAEPLVELMREQMRSLKAVAPRMTAVQGLAASNAILPLVAACLNASADPSAASGPVAAQNQLMHIKRFIERNLRDAELTPARIARDCGVSRSKLYALFEPMDGVSAYLRDRRLRWAMLTLAGRNGVCRSVQEAAHACGFTNDSAFSRAFRRRYGITPRDALQSGTLPGFAEARDEPANRRYEDWLQRLGI